MKRRPPRSTPLYSSAASDVYKRRVDHPAGPQTPAVHALLKHLERVGYRHAPRSLGLDDAGRHVLEYILGRMVRHLHDALDGWAPPADAIWSCPIPTDGDDLIVHNDIAPWNIVVAPDRLVLIDWDG